MNVGIEFNDELPECLGRRLDIPFRESCSSCSKEFECLASIWSVLQAVRDGRIPAAGYQLSELRELRRRYVAICQHRSFDDDHIDAFARRISFEQTQALVERVLRPRSIEDAATEAEITSLLEEVQVISSPVSRAVTEQLESSAATAKVISRSGSGESATAVAARAAYKFPMPIARSYQSYTNDELTEEMKRLLDRGFHLHPSLGYSAVREELCAIHIEMNFRQAHAPRFRPMHRMKKNLLTDDERAESLDRQVIDLHWRAHSMNKPISPANNYPTIFDNAPFDLAASERFAQENWTAAAKVIHLHFSEEMQWEHAILQSSDIRKKWAVIERGDVRENNAVKQVGAPQIEKSLLDAVCRAGKRQVLSSIPGMVNAWKGRRIAGDSPARVSRLIALMTGEKQRDRKAVAQTMKSLDKYLGKPSI